MLNYGYAILASEITKNIMLNGLDPYCGFLHYDMNKRTSLTFDLIESFRQQIVDKTVFSLINRKQVTLEDLDKRNNLIKLDARKLIAGKILDKLFSTVSYGGETMSYAEIISLQCDNLVNTLLNGEEFVGFYLTW
jgi:CRISPR-associated protein Cas1